MNTFRNTLWINSDNGREANLRMYQRTDFHWQEQMPQEPATKRAQVLACNTIHVSNLQQVASLINLPQTVLLYNVWIVPQQLCDEV